MHIYGGCASIPITIYLLAIRVTYLGAVTGCVRLLGSSSSFRFWLKLSFSSLRTETRRRLLARRPESGSLSRGSDAALFDNMFWLFGWMLTKCGRSKKCVVCEQKFEEIFFRGKNISKFVREFFLKEFVCRKAKV